MCFDGKTQALAKRLKKDILDKVDNVDQAREMIDEHKRQANSQVARMAELYFENSGKFGIERQLAQVWSHQLTKLSALREAIVMVLKEYLETQERAEVAALQFEPSGVSA